MKLKLSSESISSPTDHHLLDEDTPWAIREAYKTLRTNVMLALPDEGHRIIAFTSAEPHDGKTTNAINFAISLGQIEKKSSVNRWRPAKANDCQASGNRVFSRSF